MLEPYKFNKKASPTEEDIKGFDIYKLWEKRHGLTREEKNSIQKDMMTNAYSQTGVTRAGWMFPFSDVLTLFWVKVKYYGIQEIFAFDRMAIRSYYGSHNVQKIIKVK